MYYIIAYMHAALCTGSDQTPITKMCKDGQGGKFAWEGQVYWGYLNRKWVPVFKMQLCS